MSYGLKYTIPFQSLDGEDCVVEIHKRDYRGQATELIASDTPFRVEVDSEEFMYAPLRLSTATLSVVGGDYLQELFSTDHTQHRVDFLRGGILTWCGFIAPEVYTQDYSGEVFTYEVQCVSALTVLEFIPFTPEDEDGTGFISLYNLIRRCIQAVGYPYASIIFPQTYRATAEGQPSAEVLKDMRVSQQNFVDEEGKAMSLKEVLEEVCKFLHWTCTDWGGNLYFVDVDYRGPYIRHVGWMNDTMGAINAPRKSVQQIGFAGSNHTLDILPGYNKCSVRAESYSVGDQFEKENFEDLPVVGKVVAHHSPSDKETKYYIKRLHDPSKTKMELIQYNAQGEVIDTFDYRGDNGIYGALPISATEFKISREENRHGHPVGEEIYETANPSYTSMIQVRTKAEGQETPSQLLEPFAPILRIKGASTTYAAGAFALNASVRSTHRADLMPNADEQHVTPITEFFVSLRIGNRWYSEPSEVFFAGKHSKYKFRWLEYPTPNPSEDRVDTALVETDRHGKRPFTRMIRIPLNKPQGDKDWEMVRNKKSPLMPYDGAQGYLFELGEPIHGDLELTVYLKIPYYSRGPGHGLVIIQTFYGYFLKDFSFDFYNDKEAVKTGGQDEDGDHIYQNVVEASFINEAEEVSLKINTHNAGEASFGKVVMGGKYLTNNLYSEVEKTMIRPEESLVRRITNRYKTPHIKLTQTVKNDKAITPITLLSDDYMQGKEFMCIGGAIDYRMCNFELIMIDV